MHMFVKVCKYSYVGKYTSCYGLAGDFHEICGFSVRKFSEWAIMLLQESDNILLSHDSYEN